MTQLQIGDSAPHGTALGIDGTQVELASEWQDGPVLLTFLRHFG